MSALEAHLQSIGYLSVDTKPTVVGTRKLTVVGRSAGGAMGVCAHALSLSHF